MGYPILLTELLAGPAFVTYFEEQNSKIANGTLTAEKIEVSALMINKCVLSYTLRHQILNILGHRSGWYDPLLQNKAYVDFATDAPGYGQLQSDGVIAKINKSYYGKNGCQEQEEACYAAGSSGSSNSICINADNYCVRIMLTITTSYCLIEINHTLTGQQCLRTRYR